MPLGLGNFRAVEKLQSPSRLSSQHRVQDTTWMFPQDIQQSGVCSATVAERKSRIRGGLRADENVHNQVSFLFFYLYTLVI